MISTMVDIHSHFWEYPKHFSDDFKRQAARARGRVGGRPPLLTKDKLRTARRMYEQKDMTVEKIGEVLGVSRTTVYRALRREPAPAGPRRRSGQKTVR